MDHRPARRATAGTRAGAGPAAHHRRRGGGARAPRRRPLHRRARGRRAWSSASVRTVDTLSLSRDLVFYVFLPILLFEAGVQPRGRPCSRHGSASSRSPCPASWSPSPHRRRRVPARRHLPGRVALLFAALIAATDPVSRGLHLPASLGVSERLTTLVDAESLFNDGTAAGRVRHRPRAWSSRAETSRRLGRRPLPLDDRRRPRRWASPSASRRRASTASSTTTSSRSRCPPSSPTARSCSASALGMSGVVACVTAAIVLGNYGRARTMSPVTRVTMTTVWEYAAFVANSLIFLLIGLRMDLGTIIDHVGARGHRVRRRGRGARRDRVRATGWSRGSPAAACPFAGSTSWCGAGCAARSRWRWCSACRQPSAAGRRCGARPSASSCCPCAAGADDAVRSPVAWDSSGEARPRVSREREVLLDGFVPRSRGAGPAPGGRSRRARAAPAPRTRHRGRREQRSSRGCRRSRTSRSAGDDDRLIERIGRWWPSAGASTRCAAAAP